MRLAGLMGVVGAILLHAVFMLFGGILFAASDEGHGTTQEVELVAGPESQESEPDTPADVPPDQSPPEEAPDAEEIIRSLEQAATPQPPALEAASLSSIEAALNGQGAGAGDFAEALSFSSGGIIGGTGNNSALEDKFDQAFSMAEIDQQPRVVFQHAPSYPADMRGKKIEGVVTIIFIVDADGRVSNPRVEKSNHAAFEKPALDAIRKWKFEPGMKAGKRVACRMRAPIRFPAS